MLTKKQRQIINHSLKHSDGAVLITIEGVGDYIALDSAKHRKEATIEFMNASLVDDSCFYGDNYYGDVRPENFTIILNDPWADNPNLIETRFYKDELVSMRPFKYARY